MSTSIISSKGNYAVFPSQHQILNTLTLPFGTFTNGQDTAVYSSGIDITGGFALGASSVYYAAGGSWNGDGLTTGGYSYHTGGDAFSTTSTAVRAGDARLYGGFGLNAAGTGVSGNAVITAGWQSNDCIVGFNISNAGAGYPLDGTFTDTSQEEYYFLYDATTGNSACASEVVISGGQVTSIRLGGNGGGPGYGTGSHIGDVFTLYIIDPDYPDLAPTTLAQITVTAVANNVGGEVILRDCFRNNTLTIGNDGSVIFAPLGTNNLKIASTGEWLVNGSSSTSGQVLTSQGAGLAPKWVTPYAPPSNVFLKPTNGSTVNVDSNTNAICYTGSTLASLTVNLNDASPVEGNTISFALNDVVSSLSVTASSGTIINSPTTNVAGEKFTFVYSSTLGNVWVRG